jgi:tRNA wybutosine-synthesizing protein 3
MDDAGKHKGGEWLLVSHDPVEFSAIDRCLLTCPDCCSSTAADIHSTTSTSIDDVDSKIDIDKLVLYKFEPFILHVEARDLGCAKRLVTAAMDSGFRNSGMLVSDTRIMVQIRHTMRIDAPVAVVCEEHGQPRLLVSRAYLQLLNRMTAEKFAENRRRMETLRLAIEKCLAGGDLLARSSSSNNNNNNNKETKEERRQRKREEGLKRQMSLNRNV